MNQKTDQPTKGRNNERTNQPMDKPTNRRTNERTGCLDPQLSDKEAERLPSGTMENNCPGYYQL